ncbi:MAG: iron-sulfur cluster assembly accessory protein [Firmicutes bacterium]|nr:iron-sulfur cluster assembly accessory protein [Bacillota bacterium]
MQMVLTSEAQAQLREILAKRNALGGFVRVSARQACGCGRIGYSMGIEQSPGAQDEIVEVSGLRFVVDPESREYVDGAEIGYSADLVGGGFTIESPNVSSGCGCGGH